jgi:hypothetical protein
MNVQGIHKKMVRFENLIKNLFLTLRGHNIHCQQRDLSMCFMHYQQFASHAYCGAARSVAKMASRQEKAFSVLRFEVSRSVITVQREFRTRFKKTLFVCGASSLRVPSIVLNSSRPLGLGLKLYSCKHVLIHVYNYGIKLGRTCEYLITLT